MIKYYCDQCGDEITKKTDVKLRFTHEHLMVEIVTGKDGVWNDGEFCERCVFEALKKLMGG